MLFVLKSKGLYDIYYQYRQKKAAQLDSPPQKKQNAF